MSRRVQLPTDDDVVAARDQLLTDAQAGGPRPTVVELGRRLGLTNTTFWRHYPAIARELADTERRDGPTATGADHGSGKNLSERAAALARDNQIRRSIDNGELAFYHCWSAPTPPPTRPRAPRSGGSPPRTLDVDGGGRGRCVRWDAG